MPIGLKTFEPAMIVKSAEFIKSAVKPSQYPAHSYPEIAFIGRSNVGKSSLINTLVNRRHLVKTSAVPGRTQLINFFVINEQIGFVDLPGYGYAKVPASVRKNWGPMIETYLTTRGNLKGVVLLLDIRRMPDRKDLDVIHWLAGYRIPVIHVLTKADKISKNKTNARLAQIAGTLSTHTAEVILFSAKSRLGTDAVWRRIDETAAVGEYEKIKDHHEQS
ncbi:MAG: ribosome biogenesis GTP-binding protein YihA/YsxC [Desulfobacterales bacterium]